MALVDDPHTHVISGAEGSHVIDDQPNEFWLDGLFGQDVVRRDASLPGVQQPSPGDPSRCHIEVGVGGSLDGTNLITPLVSVITNVGTDHRDVLGDTIEQIARDKAQLEGKPLVFKDLSDPDLVKYATVQKSYYDQQVAQYNAQLSSFDAKIRQTQATIQKYQADEDRYQQREDIAQKVEDMRAILAAHGTGSRLNLYTSQDQRLELVRTLEFDHNSLIEAQHTLASLTADREAFIQQWSAQLSQDLVTARSNLDTARAQLDKAQRHQDLVRLTALEPSVVLTVAKLSVGSVLKEGDTLFTLMPVNSPLEAEFRIASRDVGFLRSGDRCVIKVDAFNYMEHGTAQGTVRWISDNAFTLDDDGRPVDAFYKSRCSVDEIHFIEVSAKFRLIPGMTLQVDVNVGSRSVAMYLLSGLIRGFSEAMREP